MEVSVLTLRDLASGRPGRRGRAEAAQKVSGEGGRGVLAPSNVNPVLPVRSTARVRGQREDRGGGGQPGPQRVCPPPLPAGWRLLGCGTLARGIGGLGGGLGRRVPPGSCPSQSPWQRLGGCPWEQGNWSVQQHLTCRYLEHRGVRCYPYDKKTVSDATLKIKRQSTRRTVSHATGVSK